MSDLSMIRGDSKTFLFAFDVDLTGASEVWMTAKSALADSDGAAIFQKTVGAGVTVVDDPTGTVQIDLDPDDTSSLSGPRDRLYYDVQVLDTDDKITTLASGRLIVRADVTTTIAAGS